MSIFVDNFFLLSDFSFNFLFFAVKIFVLFIKIMVLTFNVSDFVYEGLTVFLFKLKLVLELLELFFVVVGLLVWIIFLTTNVAADSESSTNNVTCGTDDAAFIKFISTFASFLSFA